MIQRLSASGWRAMVAQSVSEQDLAQVFESLRISAMAGDLRAAELVLAYRIGKPTPAPVTIPDGLELGELNTVEQIAGAIGRVLEAQLEGTLSEEQAESLRRTLDRAMKLVLATDENVTNDAREVVVRVESYDRGRISVSDN